MLADAQGVGRTIHEDDSVVFIVFPVSRKQVQAGYD